MRQIILYIILLLFTYMGLTSCNDWMDTSPKDQILEKDIYKSERAIQNMLNGLYLRLVDGSLYGKDMTSTLTDALAHYYTYESTTEYTLIKGISEFNYESEPVNQLLGNVWSNAYGLIFEINQFIYNLTNNTNSNVIAQEKKDILLGEAYGLRAFVHFDLFRIFGPIYIGNEAVESIPYNKDHYVNSHEYLKSSDFIQELQDDLRLSIELLQDDPIRTLGVLDKSSLGSSINYYEFRNRRMNLYAVKALQARVLLYVGKGEEAAGIAQDIISSTIESGDKSTFFWTPVKIDQTLDNDFKVYSFYSGNYIAYHDVIFGVENLNMYSTWKDLTEGNAKYKIYSTNKSLLYNRIFNLQGVTNIKVADDVRGQCWDVSQFTTNLYVNKKFVAPIDPIGTSNSPLLSFQPLIRMSEMYYIIAENAMNSGDAKRAVQALNTVLKARGWVDISLLKEDVTSTAFFDELRREYYREFFGEGQTFFYLKRRAEPIVFNPNTGALQYMNMDKYKINIPTVELEAN